MKNQKSQKSKNEPLVLVRYMTTARLETKSGSVLEEFDENQIHFVLAEYFEEYFITTEYYEHMDRSNRYLIEEYYEEYK